MAINLERVIMSLYFSWLPILYGHRRKARLPRFEFGNITEVPYADIDLGHNQDCLPACKKMIAGRHAYLRKYDDWPDKESMLGGIWRLTPLVLNVARYEDSDAYDLSLKNQPKTKGSILRQIKKAHRLGFYTQRFANSVFAQDIDRIIKSTKWRAGAPVVAAFLSSKNPENRVSNTRAEPAKPKCNLHWTLHWGVFEKQGGDQQAGKTTDRKLVGYVKLRRVGNSVLVLQFMGHKDYLARGCMVLLHRDIVAWLIESQDPWTRGVEYLHYGAVEHAKWGLLGWKRRMQYLPRRFRLRQGS